MDSFFIFFIFLFFFFFFFLQYMNSHFVKEFLALAEKCLSVGHFSRRILITETYPCIPGILCKYVLNNCFLTVFLFLVYNYKI